MGLVRSLAAVVSACLVEGQSGLSGFFSPVLTNVLGGLNRLLPGFIHNIDVVHEFHGTSWASSFLHQPSAPIAPEKHFTHDCTKDSPQQGKPRSKGALAGTL